MRPLCLILFYQNNLYSLYHSVNQAYLDRLRIDLQIRQYIPNPLLIILKPPDADVAMVANPRPRTARSMVQVDLDRHVDADDARMTTDWTIVESSVRRPEPCHPQSIPHGDLLALDRHDAGRALRPSPDRAVR